MSPNYWARILGGLLLSLAAVGGDGFGMTARPTIKVAIGMTVEELSAGSTYPFTPRVPTFQAPLGQKIPYPGGVALPFWTIAEPYDLTFIYNGRELKEDNIGGDLYLSAVRAGSLQKKIIDHINITFQNHRLTLDEALAVAKRLNEWFVAGGFVPPASDAPDVKQFVSPFTVAERERSGAPYRQQIATYDDARTALLDPQSRIIALEPFDLVTDDANAGLSILNVRRRQEDVSGESDESQALTERVYVVSLTIVARPLDRYWDFKAR